jgi:hypothetical protein
LNGQKVTKDGRENVAAGDAAQGRLHLEQLLSKLVEEHLHPDLRAVTVFHVGRASGVFPDVVLNPLEAAAAVGAAGGVDRASPTLDGFADALNRWASWRRVDHGVSIEVDRLTRNKAPKPFKIDRFRRDTLTGSGMTYGVIWNEAQATTATDEHTEGLVDDKSDLIQDVTGDNVAPATIELDPVCQGEERSASWVGK